MESYEHDSPVMHLHMKKRQRNAMPNNEEKLLKLLSFHLKMSLFQWHQEALPQVLVD
jgi:hypothetical protein